MADRRLRNKISKMGHHVTLRHMGTSDATDQITENGTSCNIPKHQGVTVTEPSREKGTLCDMV